MPPSPTPPMQPTVLPACAPRVRSTRSGERYGAVQLRRTARPASLARTSSTISATTRATARAARTIAAIAAITTIGASTTLAPVAAFAFCIRADRGHGLRFTASLSPPASRLSFRLRRKRLHRQAQTSALVAIEKLDLHAVSLLDDVF